MKRVLTALNAVHEIKSTNADEHKPNMNISELIDFSKTELLKRTTAMRKKAEEKVVLKNVPHQNVGNQKEDIQ